MASIPSSNAPRRGGPGRRGGRSAGGAKGSTLNAAAAQPDDTEQVRILRSKYAEQLAMLRELFPDWTDEDLLLVLQDVGGVVEMAVGRISEGHAEQFSSVKSKKQVKKDALSSATPATFQNSTAAGSATIVSTTRGGRGGAQTASRGGRGGAATRGARGGGRGGRGAGGRAGVTNEDAISGETTTSHAAVNATTAAAPAVAASTGPTWADTLAGTSKQNGKATGGAWGDDTEGLDLQTDMTSAPTAAPSASVPAAAKASSHEEAEKTKEESKSQNPVASALSKMSSKLVPKGSKMSWAQIARTSEQPKAQPEQGKLTTAAISAPIEAKLLPPTADAVHIEASNANVQASVPAAATAAPVDVSAQSVPTPAGAVSEAMPSAEAQAPVVSIPPVQTTTNTAVDTRANAGRPGQSQRNAQRARQDAAVVMPGGNARLDNLGKQFGTLSFLGGDDADKSADLETVAGSAGQRSYAAQTAGLSQPDQEQSAASAAVQAAPLHQDAHTQAQVEAQQDGANKSAFDAHQQGYQQALQQHQQAHQQALQAQQQHSAQTQQHQQHTDAVSQYSTSAQPTSYGATPQQTAQQGAAGLQTMGGQQQYGDYSSMYSASNVDSQRLGGYYGGNYENGLASRGAEDRSGATNSQQVAQVQQQQSQQLGADANSTAPHLAPQQPPQQQQYANMFPYYYPYYPMPNQFQHYGQPAAGYGQYLYGAQPQHPTKPATPANVQSPYAQSLPHNDLSAATAPYGSNAGAQTANLGQYGQSPAIQSGLASSAYGDYSRQQGLGAATTDYSKLYGNTASSTIPGLGGFLGSQQPTSTSSNDGNQNKGQQNSAIDSAYRPYDSAKLGGSTGGAPGQAQRQGSGAQNNAGGQTQSTPVQSSQQLQQQQQQQQQQQPYYQQYNAYGQHQQPNATSATGYGNYPYRQYWGQ